jgi:hypothetical protein
MERPVPDTRLVRLITRNDGSGFAARAIQDIKKLHPNGSFLRIN